MARTQTIYQDPRQLRRAVEAHVQLGNAIPRAVQDALNETALESLRYMESNFDAEIDRGPAKFTEIHPGSSRSAVDRKRGRWQPGQRDIEASIHVQRLQSAYLKYMLGISPVRYPGDTGTAKARNFIPQDENDLSSQGVNLSVEGNLPSKALQKLQSQANKSATDRARYQLRLQAARAAGKKAPKRNLPNRDEVFYGRPYRGTPIGWWQRKRTGSVKLLILAARKSRYPKPYLIPAWNNAVLDAAKDLVPLAVRKIEQAAQRVAQGGSGGGSAGGSGSGSVI